MLLSYFSLLTLDENISVYICPEFLPGLSPKPLQISSSHNMLWQGVLQVCYPFHECQLNCICFERRFCSFYLLSSSQLFTIPWIAIDLLSLNNWQLQSRLCHQILCFLGRCQRLRKVMDST